MKSFGSNALLFLVFALCITRSLQLTCGPCNKMACPPEEDLGCIYGYGQDECACCPSCLKGPGETCGGTLGTQENCTEGYTCVASDDPNNQLLRTCKKEKKSCKDS